MCLFVRFSSFFPRLALGLMYITRGSLHWRVLPVWNLFMFCGAVVIQAGGETVFPKVWPSVTQAAAQADAAPARAAAVASGLLGDDPGSWEAKMSGECGSRFAVTPKKGDALLFYSQVVAWPMAALAMPLLERCLRSKFLECLCF
jgi:hypothetical protein